MRILFLMTDLQLAKYYYQTLRFLLNRGHRIHLAFFNPREPEKEAIYHNKLAAEFPRTFSFGDAPRKRADVWYALCVASTWAIDYLLYFRPALGDAHRLRERVEIRMHPAFVWLASKFSPERRPACHAFMNKLLRGVYSAIPVSSRIKKFIAKFSPDLVLVTPLVFQGSLQPEYLKAASSLGIPTAHCVASWDNLTTKGAIKGNPDRIILWNEIQKREAVTLHDVSPDRIVITGAQYFDDWFLQRPSRTREDFCKLTGLRPDGPMLLYLCSSDFMAPNEAQFLPRWISAIRQCTMPDLADAGILIRPHPKYVEQWKTVDLTAYENVVVWPADGEYASSDTGKRNFYDSVFHSIAVVGVNTTAMIESAIIGRCVLSVNSPELHESQSNTIHFQYMLQENGGFLYLAQDLDEHLRQLQDVRDKGDLMKEQVRSFVRNFVRPRGIENACVPILARSIEETVHSDKQKARFSCGKIITRVLLYPVALSFAILRLLTYGKRKERKLARKRLLQEAKERGHDPLDYVGKKPKAPMSR